MEIVQETTENPSAGLLSNIYYMYGIKRWTIFLQQKQRFENYKEIYINNHNGSKLKYLEFITLGSSFTEKKEGIQRVNNLKLLVEDLAKQAESGMKIVKIYL